MSIFFKNILIEKINGVTKKEDKKKTQTIRKQLYKKQKNWEIENKDAIEEYNKIIENEGLILKESRIF